MAPVESWAASFNQNYMDWLQFLQNTPWSQNVWGSYQKGYYDGWDKGRTAGWNQGRGLDFNAVPQPDLADFGRWARAVRSTEDPNNPWADLRNREVITGPGAF